jgi:hypothetical protein
MSLDLKEGNKGKLIFGDKSTAKVVIKRIKTYPATGMSPDIFFAYQDGETNKQLIHPTMKDEFPLPYNILVKYNLFIKDEE